ncbi:dynein axonemal light chain 4 isoform X2 [Rhineura floridana]|nr:dynein axonemal light chain 4 isoform X2 [Rhineura floridana]
MPEEMRVEAMELCVTACEKYATNNESAAKMIKETMDKKFGSSWHVVIGEGFGFEITHEVGSCKRDRGGDYESQFMKPYIAGGERKRERSVLIQACCCFSLISLPLSGRRPEKGS